MMTDINQEPSSQFQKTYPAPEDFEWSPERYAERLKHWQDPRADFFGTFWDWSDEDVQWLLQELCEGLWDDCGDNHPNALSVSHLLQAALYARQEKSEGPDYRMDFVLSRMGDAIDILSSDVSGSPRAKTKAQHAYRALTGYTRLKAAIEVWDRPTHHPAGHRAKDMRQAIADERRIIKDRQKQIMDSEKRIQRAQALLARGPLRAGRKLKELTA